MKYMVIVPTLNAARDWERFLPALLRCATPQQVLIVDSESIDGTPDLARASGFQVIRIERRQFNHGATRQSAVQFVGDADLVVFLTQDAILAAPDSLERLVGVFEQDPLAAAAYGRQLPRPTAGLIERHARTFNYPAQPSVKNFASKDSLGFKAIFLSNSFAAYRRTALEQVGGFPANVILGEDTVTAARLLSSGWRIHYVPDALVFHSHAYSYWQEFQRYFDMGVLHVREDWLQRTFGKTGGEGRRFVFSELAYLWPRNALLIPSALLRTLAKLAGYRLGLAERLLGRSIKSRLSMHAGYWRQ